MKPLIPPDPWKEFGIPGQCKFLRLLYNEPSNSLIAVMEDTEQDRPPLQRLFYRRVAEEIYRPVMARDLLEDQKDAFCCATAPFLIYNEMRWSEPAPVVPPLLKGVPPQPEEKAWAGEWFGIRRFNLETGEDKRMIDRQNLQASRCGDGWVREILSVSADGSHAVCIVGLYGSPASFSVYEVSLFDGLKREITKLSKVFL